MSQLFKPIHIGSMELRNRFAMSAITTNYGSADFEVTERLIKYHETRAAGGVGLITVEMCSVDVAQRYQPQALSLGEDRFIEGHRELVERVHAHGAKIQPQISHPGPESMTDPVGPSVNVAAGTGWSSRKLEVEEIEQIMHMYAAAAVRAQQAGYDGMELHAAHAYMLLGSFLSTQRNRRDDDYRGDSFEGRSKFLLDTIRCIKAATGADFPITLRISGYEYAFDGRELNDTQLLAPLLVEAGIDCIQVSGGVSHDKLVGQIVYGADFGDGCNVAVASAIKKVVDIPIMVVGRIHSPEYAEQIVASGQADIVMMARPFLADPELPNKVKAGNLKSVRRCLSCQNCIDSMLIAPFDADMNCAVNAASGRETELLLTPAEKPRQVVVIGGGTAGMEAARVAATRGHNVTLLEANTRLGGSLFFAATVHSDNELFLDYLLEQMKTLPIDIRLGHQATTASIKAFNPDAVIVATGARVTEIEIPGSHLSHVVSGMALRNMISGMLSHKEARKLPALQRMAGMHLAPLTQRWIKPQWVRRATKAYMPLGKKLVLIGSDLAAVELAEYIAERGRRVTLLAPLRQLMPEVGPKRRQEQLAALDRRRVEVISAAQPTLITENTVEFEFAGSIRSVHADSVVIAGQAVADTRFYDELAGRFEQVHAIGDCTGLGLIRKATEDAMRAACEI